MVNTEAKPSTTTKWGWRILMVVSALLILNGVSWFFIGPSRTATYMATVTDMSEQQIKQLYPDLVNGLSHNRRQVAVWFTAFGSLALILAVQGSRTGAPWIWNTTWIVVAVPLAIGLIYTPGLGLNFDNVSNFLFGGVALVGQLMARRRSSPS